jgi:hypothetical protein
MTRMNWEKRRRKEIVDKRGPLPFWWQRWGPALRSDPKTRRVSRPKKAKPVSSPKKAKPSFAADDLRARIEKAVREALGEVQSRRRDGGASSADFSVGVKFRYRNSRGTVTEYRIAKVVGGVAYTEDGKQFKVRTLEKASRGHDPDVELSQPGAGDGE